MRDGTLSPLEFRLLFAGMIDTESPETTEPLIEKATRKTREAHLASSKKRSGW